ncbi:hypothetical protein TNCT_240681 [Trichonephila clavata]|uniref:Uncharacterized protein n=1 Tax=Trichonephila clavata TaxID=2740835 RepID=A0A8X6LM28_TRICU|nr:hypothetical protein TNCT_240681 [Trichonephila clavata]
MKDGRKEECECPVAIEFYNKIVGGVDLADQIANVNKLNRKFGTWWKKSIVSPIGERCGKLMDCALRTQTLKNPTT